MIKITESLVKGREMPEMAWPSKNDDAFASGINEATNAFPHWITEWNRNIAIADGFIAAAERIVSTLEEGHDERFADKYLFPVGFLYRHYLELSMKEIISLGQKLRMLNSDETAIRTHDLRLLWQKARRVIVSFWEEHDKEPVDAVERVVEQFYTVDDTGQGFRYSRDTKGKITLSKAPRIVSLSEMKKVMRGIARFFDGCQMGLENAVDSIDETQDHYW